jgi:hypothetical protein
MLCLRPPPINGKCFPDPFQSAYRDFFVFLPGGKDQAMKLTRAFAIISATLAMATISGAGSTQTRLPNPVLYLTRAEPYVANGQNFMRYRYDVFNKDAYPAAMFAAAPGLPPCGANTNASRTWVDFFDSGGTRLYGFCALGGPQDLGQIWFALPEGQIPPSYVYVELNDRQTNTKYRSNLADTVM